MRKPLNLLALMPRTGEAARGKMQAHHVLPAKFGLWTAACALSCVTAAGCSGEAKAPLDNSAMAKPVAQMADAADNRQSFQRLFVAGAAPDEKQRRRYAEWMYQVSSIQPTAEAQADLRVKILDGSGAQQGEATWTVVQEAGKWKLKSAPLP